MEVVLGWEDVQAAVGGNAQDDIVMLEPEQPTSSSLLHMEVLRLLCRDLAAHDARTEVDDGVYVQDILLMPLSSSSSPSSSSSLPVIVEVDGPPHFFNNMPRRSRGDHKLKVRLSLSLHPPTHPPTHLPNPGVRLLVHPPTHPATHLPDPINRLLINSLLYPSTHPPTRIRTASSGRKRGARTAGW